jgi:hypothetical protein
MTPGAASRGRGGYAAARVSLALDAAADSSATAMP